MDELRGGSFWSNESSHAYRLEQLVAYRMRDTRTIDDSTYILYDRFRSNKMTEQKPRS